MELDINKLTDEQCRVLVSTIYNRVTTYQELVDIVFDKNIGYYEGYNRSIQAYKDFFKIVKLDFEKISKIAI